MPKNKKHKAALTALIIGFICLIAINTASWATYWTITIWLSSKLEQVGINDPLFQWLIILIGALIVVCVLGGWKLRKAIKEIFGVD